MLLYVGIGMIVVGLLLMFGPVILALLLGGAGALTVAKGNRQVLERVARERPTKPGKPVSLFGAAAVLIGGQMLIMAAMLIGGLIALAGVVAIVVHVLQAVL